MPPRNLAPVIAPAAGPGFARTMNRLGFCCLLLALASDGAVRLSGRVLAALPPAALLRRLLPSPWYSLVLSFVSLYLIGLPVFLLSLHLLLPNTAPSSRFGQGPNSPTALQFARLFALAYTLTTLGAVLSESLQALIELVRAAPVYRPVQPVTQNSFWPDLIAVCFVAPVGEEFLFRWLFYKKLAGFGLLPYMLASGLAFGLFHGNLQQFFYTAALGCLLAYTVWRTKSVLWAMLLHGLINLAGAILPTLLPTGLLGSFLYRGAVMALGGWSALFTLRFLRARRPPQSPGLPAHPVRAALLTPGVLLFCGYCFSWWLFYIFF